ncbi:MAG TPA: serine/threonine-protein kinase, partial [Actinotalea sp.]|nr:serine/threonine-protein kinase [Actinotalea sp.]
MSDPSGGSTTGGAGMGGMGGGGRSMALPGYGDMHLIAHGGFSSVYASVQLQYNRPVAIKVLDVGFDDDKLRRQYTRECAATGLLTGHPNILTILDSGFSPDGKPYLVMDYCANGALADRLRQEGPLPVADVLRVGVKMAGALETAHQAGILHRDLKPANILITAYGEPALSDFGIASVTSRLETSVTMSAMTPNHAPPEVLEGQKATAASDVYSLASTLYTLLAGRPAFAQDDSASILAFITRVLREDVPPIARADVPASLQAVLAQAMAKDPADRPASAGLFGYELQKIQTELGMPYTELVMRSASGGWAAQSATGADATVAPGGA